MNASTPLRRYARPLAVALMIVTTMLVVARASRAEVSPALDDANRAFGEGRYGAAVATLQALVAQRGYSAPLLFDLGNAYLRDGQPTSAILAYERAQLLAPRDPAIAANLAGARSAAGVTDDRGSAARAARWLSLDEWTWLASGGFWFGVGALAVAWGWKSRRPMFVTAAVGAALACGTSLAAVGVDAQDLDRGLVMKAAPVLVSPFETAQSDGALAAGTTIHLGQRHDGFVFVNDGHGRSGWIERALAEPVIP